MFHILLALGEHPIYSKFQAWIAGAVAGLIGFGITQSIYGQAGFAVFVSASSAALVAFLTNYPKWLAAKQHLRESEAKLESTRIAEMFDRMQIACRFEREALIRKAEVLEEVADVLKASKHELLGEIQRIVFHIRNLETTMIEHDLTPPEFHVIQMKEFFKREDDKIKEVKAKAQTV